MDCFICSYIFQNTRLRQSFTSPWPKPKCPLWHYYFHRIPSKPMSRHLIFLFFYLATVLFSGLIFLHSPSRYWPWEWPVFSLCTILYPPILASCDTKQISISHLCSPQVRVWFPIRLSRRVTSLWRLCWPHETVASTVTRPKWSGDEAIEELFV